MIENRVPILVGPTAVGKTSVSIHLAEWLDGEIVSADSRQIYRYMNIGTAKPSPAEQQYIPHHFIDICDPDEHYSAGTYGREARLRIKEIQASAHQPVVVGGSGFYLRALADGLFAPGISSTEVKKRWHERIEKEGPEAIHAILSQVDPVSGARLHPNDRQRVVRALEVYELTGEPLSAFQPGKEEPAQFQPLFIGLIRPREVLYERINHRVLEMLADGLLAEAQHLQDMGYGPHLNALRTVGYQEVHQYFENKIDYTQMVDLIQRHSRQYAKRQLTWFRKDPRIQWIDVHELTAKEAATRVLQTMNGT